MQLKRAATPMYANRLVRVSTATMSVDNATIRLLSFIIRLFVDLRKK